MRGKEYGGRLRIAIAASSLQVLCVPIAE
jgi:hypothetical protein